MILLKTAQNDLNCSKHMYDDEKLFSKPLWPFENNLLKSFEFFKREKDVVFVMQETYGNKRDATLMRSKILITPIFLKTLPELAFVLV